MVLVEITTGPHKTTQLTEVVLQIFACSLGIVEKRWPSFLSHLKSPYASYVPYSPFAIPMSSSYTLMAQRISFFVTHSCVPHVSPIFPVPYPVFPLCPLYSPVYPPMSPYPTISPQSTPYVPCPPHLVIYPCGHTHSRPPVPPCPYCPLSRLSPPLPICPISPPQPNRNGTQPNLICIKVLVR